MRVNEFEFFQQPPPIVSDFADGRLLMQPPFAPFLVFEMLNGIGDVGVFSFDSSSFESAVEELPGRPNKRVSLAIFLVARLLADKGQRRAYRTFAQYRSHPAMHHRFGGGNDFI